MALSCHKVVAAGAVYFAIVFAFGFLFGVIRTLWLVPRVGVRWAELVETPVMLVVIFLAARWTSRRFELATRRKAVLLGVGVLALAMLLAAEAGLVLLQGSTIAEYLAARDPVSGMVYALSLLLFAAMPTLVTRRAGIYSTKVRNIGSSSE